jgi:iron complex outermembrane recepter protein
MAIRSSAGLVPHCIALALASLCCRAAAQPPEAERITVSGRRESVLSEVPSSVTVLGGRQIDAQLSRNDSIFSLLEALVPGLAPSDQSSFLSSGAGTGPLLRGRPASVLINGVPVNTLLRGNGIDLALIDTNAIGRIEVQRGATSTFGFGASGGLIDIQTRRGTTPDLQVQAALAGSLNTGKASNSGASNAYLGVGRRLASGLDFWAGVGIAQQGQRFDPDGRPVTADEANIANVDVNIGYALSDSSDLRLTATLYDRKTRRSWVSPFDLYGISADGSFDIGSFELPSGLDPRNAYADPSQESRGQGQQASTAILTYRNSDLWGGSLQLSLLHQRNRLDNAFLFSSLDAPPDTFYAVDANQLRNDRLGVRSSFSHDVDLSAQRTLSLTYGLDHMRDKMSRPFQSGGGDLATVEVPVLGSIDYERPAFVLNPISPPVQMKSSAVFTEAALSVGAWRVRGGLRYERYEPRSLGYDEGGFIYEAGRIPSFDATLVSLGVIWSMSASTQVYAGLSQGLEITELGRALRSLGRRNEPVTQAALDRARLQPAKTTELELGMRGRAGQTDFTAATFVSRASLSSQVQINPDDPTGPLIPLREPQRTWGLEATAEHRFSGGSTLGAAFTWQQGKRRVEGDASWTPQNNATIAPARLTVTGDFVLTSAWSTQWQATWSARRDKLPARPLVANGYFDDEGPAASYLLVDAGITYRLAKGSLVLGVENLLNRRYIPGGNRDSNLYAFAAEGRRARLGWKGTF